MKVFISKKMNINVMINNGLRKYFDGKIAEKVKFKISTAVIYG